MKGYTADGSVMDIGSAVTARMKGGATTGAVTLTMNSDFFWSFYVQGIGVGTEPNANKAYAFGTKSIYGIIDSGSSLMIVPPSTYKGIVNFIWSNYGKPKYQS